MFEKLKRIYEKLLCVPMPKYCSYCGTELEMKRTPGMFCKMTGKQTTNEIRLECPRANKDHNGSHSSYSWTEYL